MRKNYVKVALIGAMVVMASGMFTSCDKNGGIIDPNAKSGKTGDCTWTYTPSNATLTISGSGAMENYDKIKPNGYLILSPWSEYPYTNLVIGDGVTRIGVYAFSDPSLTTISSLGSNVYTIGRAAFAFSSLTSLTIPNSVTSIGEQAFVKCKALTSVTIESSVIGQQAFEQCTSLTSVTLGNGVTSIGQQAFKDCTSLTSITIPNSVTSIGQSAFSSCSTLISLIIGSGVRSISMYAFSFTPLTNVTCLATTPPSLGYNNFNVWLDYDNGYVYLDTLYVPVDALTAYQGNSDWSEAFDEILAIKP